MKQIAVPVFPGLNGVNDVINRIKEYGMKPVPLYFHIGHKDLDENAKRLLDSDGVIMSGGFPYEDRLGFGTIPSKLTPFANSLREFVDSGKPLIAFCAGNQMAHGMGLVFPKDSKYKISMEQNICDEEGRIMRHGFLDKKSPIIVSGNPQRNAFTRLYKQDEYMNSVIDHGGGRFSADDDTLTYLLDHGLIMTQYCDENGLIKDNYPINPNGSIFNIESVSNTRGNVLVGMVHHERRLNALEEDRSNYVFKSMEQYLDDGCPDLSKNETNQHSHFDFDTIKDFAYLKHEFDPNRTVDIYVQMLTDDNERNTAQLFLGKDFQVQRRRLIRVEVKPEYAALNDTTSIAQTLVEKISQVDVLNGIMLKKDLPIVKGLDGRIEVYTKVGQEEDGKTIRKFLPQQQIVPNLSSSYEKMPELNVDGHQLREQIKVNYSLDSMITRIAIGETWFFDSELKKKYAIGHLLG